jgi:EAL domain-containing protein (putative c-di-GMP-specific phosphodiesterase class I)
VVEGVEQEDQLALLAGFGALTVQGYYYYRPLPAEEARRLLEGGRR